MISSRLGEFAALLTAVCFTFGAMSFEVACKRAGALLVNWMRLAMGLILLSVFCLIYRGQLLPPDASAHTWFWLLVSGVIGFAIGDLLLFRAFIVIGSRISMLIMALVPPLTAIIGWAIMGERLGSRGLVGMILTVGGIAIVVLERKRGEEGIRWSHPIAGIGLALGGVAGQALQLVLSKYGMRSYDPFAATQIRIIAGALGSLPVLVLMGGMRRVGPMVRNSRMMIPTTLGAIFGPFLGVAFSLLAVQHTSTGIASTIMAIVPVLIIPPAVIFFKEKVTFSEVLGAVMAVSGVVILFI